MNPGDVVFMHPDLIHGSWPNQSQTSRRVFINGFSYPGANQKPYPGRGSARRISLITGQELTQQQATLSNYDTARLFQPAPALSASSNVKSGSLWNHHH